MGFPDLRIQAVLSTGSSSWGYLQGALGTGKSCDLWKIQREASELITEPAQHLLSPRAEKQVHLPVFPGVLWGGDRWGGADWPPGPTAAPVPSGWGGAPGHGLELMTSTRAPHSLPVPSPGRHAQRLHASLLCLTVAGIQVTFPASVYDQRARKAHRSPTPACL